jgi:hypothetical protein
VCYEKLLLTGTPLQVHTYASGHTVHARAHALHTRKHTPCFRKVTLTPLPPCRTEQHARALGVALLPVPRRLRCERRVRPGLTPPPSFTTLTTPLPLSPPPSLTTPTLHTSSFSYQNTHPPVVCRPLTCRRARWMWTC